MAQYIVKYDNDDNDTCFAKDLEEAKRYCLNYLNYLYDNKKISFSDCIDYALSLYNTQSCPACSYEKQEIITLYYLERKQATIKATDVQSIIEAAKYHCHYALAEELNLYNANAIEKVIRIADENNKTLWRKD